jgi:hypothetical protein
MRIEASPIDQEPWKYPDKSSMPHGLGSRVRFGLFIVALGVVGMVAFMALLHIAEVIP